MQRMVLSSDDVPTAERFAYWREAVTEGLWGISGERNKDQETPFNGRVIVSRSGPLQHFRSRSDSYPVFRGPRDIARRTMDNVVLVYREHSVVRWFASDRGREFITRPGDLVVSNRGAPIALQPRGQFDYEAWWLPRKLIAPHLPVSPSFRSLVLPGRDGVAGIVKAYLGAITEQLEALDDRETDLVADNFCRLVAVACGANAGEQQEAIRLARLEEAKRYITLHLTNPALTPEKAAAALKMSLRQLHYLFEPSGETFTRYVLRRRLEECRATLMNPIGDRSVTDIALGWGFNSLETFHRNFRRTFGATPGEVRGQAMLAG
jgi:AraC-like DNA-binding protein